MSKLINEILLNNYIALTIFYMSGGEVRCYNCGTDNAEELEFCAVCGYRLVNDVSVIGCIGAISLRMRKES